MMDVSLKQRLIVDIRVMVPFITADIIQMSRIEQGGGTLSPSARRALLGGGRVNRF